MPARRARGVLLEGFRAPVTGRRQVDPARSLQVRRDLLQDRDHIGHCLDDAHQGRRVERRAPQIGVVDGGAIDLHPAGQAGSRCPIPDEAGLARRRRHPDDVAAEVPSKEQGHAPPAGPDVQHPLAAPQPQQPRDEAQLRLLGLVQRLGPVSVQPGRVFHPPVEEQAEQVRGLVVMPVRCRYRGVR